MRLQDNVSRHIGRCVYWGCTAYFETRNLLEWGRGAYFGFRKCGCLSMDTVVLSCTELLSANKTDSHAMALTLPA